jgi:hypothetical protein
MKYLSEIFGLVTDNDPTTENGQLFLEELSLLENKGIYFNIMYKQLQNSLICDGLYHRNPDLTDRTMSHDNMSGIMSWSFVNKTDHRKEIWRYLVKHLGTYDNTRGKSKQLSRLLPFNPGHIFIWGLCAGSRVYLLGLPIYFVSLLFAVRKDYGNTTGKILSWVELYPHRNHWCTKHLFNYFQYRMRKMYGHEYLKELMNIYHGKNSKDFPINKFFGIGI